MKYIILVGDGMSDRPCPDLDGKTPLEVAEKPEMDALCLRAEMGQTRTIPGSLPAGSDTANLSLMGYDPAAHYTGRSPLEAVSMGVEMGDKDLVFRCNLVHVTDEPAYEARTMVSHSAGMISQQEAEAIMKDLMAHFADEPVRMAVGATYRHVLVMDTGEMPYKIEGLKTTPPHDILGEKIAAHLPQGPLSEQLLHFMKKSAAFLENHPVNLARKAKGLETANSIWLWGEGRKPSLAPFYEKFHLKGSVVSAVPLLHGIGICAGLRPIHVEGATGELETNYEGKVQAALHCLKEGDDFVFLHLEAPDECGHSGIAADKVEAIHRLDQRVLKPLLKGLADIGEDYRLLLLPDHATPLTLRTHVHDPIPYLLYDSSHPQRHADRRYTEAQAAALCPDPSIGHELIARFLLG